MLHESANVRVEADDGTATLWLDFPGDPPNLLSAGRIAEIARAVEAVGANPFIEILVVRSAKPAGFSAGYDPDPLLALDTDADRRETAAAGQRLTGALAAAPFITLAVLDGPCLGAGLELALACDYRLAVATPDAMIGFPEVANGFLPGWGGITRLTRLVGVRAALDLLLSGRPLPARQARSIGLVDHAFCTRRAKIEVRTFLDRLQLRPHKPARRRRDWFGTGGVLQDVRRALADGDGADRPAGFAAVRVAEAALRSEADGLAAERREFAAVLGSQAARAGLELLRLVHRPTVVRPGPRNPVPPVPAVVGLVGEAEGWVAREVAVRGGTVLRAGRSWVEPPSPDEGDGRSPADTRLTPLERDQAAARVRVNGPDDPWAGFADAGLVLLGGDASVPAAEAHVRPRAVIAVVGRPVAPAQESADRPGRVAGLAFPVFPGESPVVEVVAGPETEPDALAALAGWVRHLGLVPVVVSDRPTQVVRRVLAAAWDEAVRLVAEGVPIAAVDQAGVRAGFGRGPLEAIDVLGFEAVGPFVPRLAPLATAGLRGRAAGDGFYHHPPDNPPSPSVIPQLLLADAAPPARGRLALRVVNEAAAALGDEAHAGPAEVDLAVALGAGLLRPHGGPLRYADVIGLPATVARLAGLAKAFGRRFHPHPELARRAAAGERFHEAPPAPARHPTAA